MTASVLPLGMQTAAVAGAPSERSSASKAVREEPASAEPASAASGQSEAQSGMGYLSWATYCVAFF